MMAEVSRVKLHSDNAGSISPVLAQLRHVMACLLGLVQVMTWRRQTASHHLSQC